MNRARRKVIAAVVSALETIAAGFRELKDRIEAVKDEERAAFDSMSEGHRESIRGHAAEAAVEALDEAHSAAEAVSTNLNSTINYLDTARKQ
ncbi:hypothetical protein CN213_16045 [Sinorhizobium meliloti]|uniref:hypothetical protein n=1 Tax=Rhizobium meliloti TaxID=382 RepID=UPI000FD7CE1B|nr:hypothetical protein [Sinorhizobium meliloti]RVH56257.1 hypothetical protein CN213_16045 [Sinorhizobium meliloti]